MRSIAFILSALALAGAAWARPYYAPKSVMIAQSEVIAVVDVQRVRPANVRGEEWTYAQAADAAVVQVIKGRLPPRVRLYAQEDFICTRIDYRPGRYLVFLRRDGDLWRGSNWYLSARPVENGSLEWYANGRESGSHPSAIRMERRPLAAVIRDVRATMGSIPARRLHPMEK